MKGFVKFLSLILICCAGYFGYNGVQKDDGDGNTFIVEDKLTIKFEETEEEVKFLFLNTSGESFNVSISFGIKGDKNFTKGDDEIVFFINNLVAYDNYLEVSLPKTGFKKDDTMLKPDKLGYANITVGKNIDIIDEYNYIHTVDIGNDGVLEKFELEGSMNYLYLGIAAGAAILAIVLFVKSGKMADPVKTEKSSKKKKEEENLWDNEPTDNFDDVSYSQSGDVVRMTEEEKAKYLEGMQVIDMKKDELE